MDDVSFLAIVKTQEMKNVNFPPFFLLLLNLSHMFTKERMRHKIYGRILQTLVLFIKKRGIWRRLQSCERRRGWDVYISQIMFKILTWTSDWILFGVAKKTVKNPLGGKILAETKLIMWNFREFWRIHENQNTLIIFVSPSFKIK